MDEWTTIKVLKAKGESIKQIARSLKISKNTVKKYLKSDKPPEYELKQKSKSNWDAFKDKIIDWSFNKRFIGSRIFEELKKIGATGSESGFYQYFRKIKKSDIAKNIHSRYETAPGIQTQFDWSEYTVPINNELRKIYVFSIILGFSRYRYYIPSLDITQNSILESIEKAFQYFGGATKELLMDNARQMVDNANRRSFKWNKRFLEFMDYFKVTPVACKVAHPFTKGKVENPFSYLENHFIKGNSFNDFDDLVKRLLDFANDINNKKHDGINDIPNNLYKSEKEHLLPLPPSFFVSMKEEWRKVNFDSLLSFEANKYSVPDAYAAKFVWVRKYLGYKIEIMSQKGIIIAEHNIPKGKGNVLIKQEHYTLSKQINPESLVGLRQQYLSIFPDSKKFLENLYIQKKIHFRYHLAKILNLTKIYKIEDIY